MVDMITVFLSIHNNAITRVLTDHVLGADERT